MSSYYQPSSFHDLILHSERQYADLPFFYSWQDKVEDFQPVSYREFISDVRRVADWLIQNGYQNKRIMLFGVNSYQWMVCYVAIATYVGVCIGAAKDWKHYDFARAVDVSQPDSIIADTALLGITSTLADSVRTVEFSELFKKDSALLENSEYYESLARDDEETCVVVFTTGTTAFPKATQLTFKNMLTNGRSLYERSPATSSDRFYMFLPMHHIYSQVCVSLAAFLLGGRLYLAHDLTNVRKELALSQPTMLSGVPLFFERILSAIKPSDMRKITSIVRILNIFHASAAIRRKVFKKVHEVFGGNIRILTSGGAPLNYKTKKLLRDMGFTILEGYGMSEASGVVSGEFPDSDVKGSVGKILDSVVVRIHSPGPDGYGEVRVRGHNVTAGYYKKGKIDTSCFDKDGYYMTSDEGFIDKDNNLFIRGRIGKSIVLASGETVSVDEITSLLKTAASSIDKVYLHDKEGYLDATIFSREERVVIERTIESVNADLPRYKQVHSWSLVDDYSLSEIK